MVMGLASRLRRLVAAILVPALMIPAPAFAQASGKGGLPIVRDAEIEALVKDYAAPILKTAGLSRGVEIVLVNDEGFNAFVSGRRIFINIGTILQAQTPNQVIGIIAHEVGHLKGGHQERLREQIDRAKTIAVVASLLGAGIAVAGAASSSGGMAQAGTGMMAGGGSLAQRSLLSYQRSEESTADRAALEYLRASKQSPRGLLETFEILERNNLFGGPLNRYLSSHPLPRERVANLEAAAKESPYWDEADSLALLQRHDLARAKIAAYTGGATAVRRTFNFDPRGRAAQYGDAIATHLAGSPAAALSKIDALIASDPRSPWFQEMRGEILQQAGRGDEAAAAYARAASLDRSGSGLLKAAEGQALVTGGSPARMGEAIAKIREGLRADPDNASAYRFLSMAYGKTNDIGSAELAMAEGYWHAGNFRQAKIFALRAQSKLKPGSPGYNQAADILAYDPNPKG